MSQPLRQGLRGHLLELGAAGWTAQTEDMLMRAWKEPHRKYHTLQHLSECLALLGGWPIADCHKPELGVALWFHDAVYDTRAADNEFRSAAMAEEVLNSLGVKPPQRSAVARLVVVTDHAREQPESEVERAMVDIDLAILGSAELRFKQYCDQVRDEYSWVPGPVYVARRSEFLAAQLQQPRLFHTEHGVRLFDSAARRNISQALRDLA